jgi:4a-hydroxytetrahydrobiopterin dehydratase
MNLIEQKCVPCEVGGTPLTEKETAFYMKDIPGWELAADNKKLSRKFSFKDFKQSMAFVNKVADIAEEEGHHPDMFIYYNKVNFELWTHEVGGLSVNDFILAAKINLIP